MADEQCPHVSLALGDVGFGELQCELRDGHGPNHMRAVTHVWHNDAPSLPTPAKEKADRIARGMTEIWDELGLDNAIKLPESWGDDA